MYKRVKPTPKEIKEKAVRSKSLDITGYIYESFNKALNDGMTLGDILVLLHLYNNYSSNIKQLSKVFAYTYGGMYLLVGRLISLGYVERVSGYSLILTSRGVSYIESFI